MRIARLSKRAPGRRALFRLWNRLLCCVLWAAGALGCGGVVAADCAPDRVDERARLAHVFDGDTVALADGRRLRLIGINTPELPRDAAPGQPFAREARDALAALLEADGEVALRFDEQRYDRYGRLLAHLYRTSGESVQAWLLRQGYAVSIAVPPNLWNQDCYRSAERRASRAHAGLWRLSYYEPLESTRARSDSTAEGFRLVRGRVVRAGESTGAIWLNLAGDVALRIAKADLRYFPEFRPRALVGKTVTARGWLFAREQGLVMQVRHPSALHMDEAGEAPP